MQTVVAKYTPRTKEFGWATTYYEEGALVPEPHLSKVKQLIHTMYKEEGKDDIDLLAVVFDNSDDALEYHTALDTIIDDPMASFPGSYMLCSNIVYIAQHQ